MDDIGEFSMLTSVLHQVNAPTATLLAFLKLDEAPVALVQPIEINYSRLREILKKIRSKNSGEQAFDLTYQELSNELMRIFKELVLLSEKSIAETQTLTHSQEIQSAAIMLKELLSPVISSE